MCRISFPQPFGRAMSMNNQFSNPIPNAGNLLRKFRESLLMSKAELARKAHVSQLTIARIEEGYPCRMDTKRKIILALGLDISEKDKVFSD